MHAVLEQIAAIGIVPVVKIDRVEDALPLAKALIDGGLPCAEVTFRTDAAQEAIRAISQAYPEMLVGAGTVLTTAQADAAMEAGAKFLVSPGLNPEVVSYCVKKGYLITPGTSNPSDVEQAIALGLDVVKFFPAEAAGGLPMIKALAAPYVNMKFMPTGGINTNNLKSYLDYPKVIACGGSWMVSTDMINAGDFAGIERVTREAIQEMLGFELAHIGINATDEQKAITAADGFSGIFGFEKKVGNSSIFLGSCIEVMKQPYLGANGHIAIRTNYIDRAVRYLTMKGCTFHADSAKYNSKGKLSAIYFAEEIGGFAVHLLQR